MRDYSQRSQLSFKERDCDPDVCKYAKGYYKRIYKAIRDIFESESLLSRKVIREYAIKHRVCPFEFSLDLSNYCDILIGDYNYAFDPRVRLIRYFEEKIVEPILLVDELTIWLPAGGKCTALRLDQEKISSLLELTKALKPSPKREIARLSISSRNLISNFSMSISSNTKSRTVTLSNLQNVSLLNWTRY